MGRCRTDTHALSLGLLLASGLCGCKPPSPSATLIFGGDVNLGGGTLARMKHDNLPFDACFSEVAALLRGADIAFVNLECCISDRGQDLDKLHSFRAPPSAAQALAGAGIDLVSIANNHSLDF